VFLFDLSPVVFSLDEDVRPTGHEGVEGVRARQNFINASQSFKTRGAFLKGEGRPMLAFVDELIFGQPYYQPCPEFLRRL